jgi:hypothetical protein
MVKGPLDSSFKIFKRTYFTVSLETDGLEAVAKTCHELEALFEFAICMSLSVTVAEAQNNHLGKKFLCHMTTPIST